MKLKSSELKEFVRPVKRALSVLPAVLKVLKPRVSVCQLSHLSLPAVLKVLKEPRVCLSIISSVSTAVLKVLKPRVSVCQLSHLSLPAILKVLKPRVSVCQLSHLSLPAVLKVLKEPRVCLSIISPVSTSRSQGTQGATCLFVNYLICLYRCLLPATCSVTPQNNVIESL